MKDICFNFENKKWKTVVIPNFNNFSAEDILFKPIYVEVDNLEFLGYMGIALNVTAEEILLLYDGDYKVEDFIDLFK